eukprot:6491783-Amphidinium_carterae.1
MTHRTCDILVGTQVVKGTTPRPVSDSLAEAITKEETRQVLEEVRTELDEEARHVWEPVLTPMEPETDEQPIAAAVQCKTRTVPAVVSFPATKTAKKHVKSWYQSINSKLLPKNQARTNLYTVENGYPRSVTVGLTVARGYGIAHQTPYFAEILADVHMLAGTRPVDERDPYLSVQLNNLSDMCSIKLHYDARNDADCSSWVGSVASEALSSWCDASKGHKNVSLAYTLVQLGFPAEQWLKQHPDSIYNVSAIQELRILPKDVDKQFSELAKAHPISMKAVRNTEGKEREKWKGRMGKELKKLVD